MSDRILTLPTITFSDQMTLYFSDLTMRLIYFGKAHTESDILIYIPDEKMLFSGDLFREGGSPGFSTHEKQDVHKWQQSLNQVLAPGNEIKHVIHGHGMVMNKNDLMDFYEFVQNQFEVGKDFDQKN